MITQAIRVTYIITTVISKFTYIAIYYLCEFIERMEVLLPFGLLLATIRTQTNLNTHNELVALMASGVRLGTLLQPFILVGLAAVMLMYINTQFWMPHALQKINHITRSIIHKRAKRLIQNLTVQNLVLTDKTSLIFQNFDSLEKKLIDVYWIRDVNDIYRIKYLYPYQEIPTGYIVDHLQRKPGGELTIVDTFESKSFPEMHFHKKDLFQGMTAPEDESVTDLWKKIPRQSSMASEKESEVLSVFYHKMIMPWLCLLAIIGPAPFCIRYTRNMPLFFIYALSIFGLVAIGLIFDSTLVLGKRQIVEPWIAILLPFIICTGAVSYKFIRI